jgi:putative oxidoreductase
MAASDFAAASTPRSESVVARSVDRLVGLCGLVPYALVAFLLRLVMARAIFLPGQTLIEGPVVSFGGIIPIPGIDLSIVLPAAVKDTTVHLFETRYGDLPIPPAFAASLVSYAEFVLPVCLLLGFATRFSALALILLTGFAAVYMTPEAFWTMHVYWIAILLVLIALGPGAIAVDALIRTIYRKL